MGLRVRQYVFDRSLWTDEAMIAVNVIHRGYAGLTHQLSLLQAAPIGWLWVEKTSTILFGTGEMALRLPELVAGCAATVGFLVLARRLLSPVAATVAVALFCLSPQMVFFASDTKPYGSDAAVAIGLLLLASTPGDRTWRRDVTFAAVAAVAVLLSYPALFVAGAVVTVRVVAALRRRDLRTAALVAALSLGWLAVFVAQYLRSVRGTADTPAMKAFWATGYAPRPLGASSALHWLGHAADRVARYPIESSVPVLLVALALLGLVAGVRRAGPTAWVAGVVAAAVIGAAVAGKYPLRDRMTLFLLPLVLLLVAWAADLTRRPPVTALTALAALTAFAGTFPHDFDLIARPYTVTEYREALTFAETHAEPGDQIWTSYQAGVLDVYYESRLHVRTGPSFAMSPAACSSPASALSDLHPGQRIWLIFGNFDDIPPAVPAYLAAFDRVARQELWHPTSAGTGAALFVLGDRVPPRIESAAGCVARGPGPQFAL